MKKTILLLCLIAAGIGLSVKNTQALPADFTNQLVTAGLSLPSDFAFLPDGRILITEQSGQVRLFKDNQLQANPILSLTVGGGGDRGLLSVAVDPNFTSNHFVYLFYTSAALHQRISKFTMNGDVLDPASEQVLLENSSTWGGHLNAGALRFGPDGKLYASMGENSPGDAQTLNNLNGKMVRINSDGSIPTDNPFYNSTSSPKSIFAYGFRNPWRFNFGIDGRALLGDVGQDTFEKLVRVLPGANYGWPLVEGNCLPNCNGITPPLLTIAHSGQGMAIVGGAINNNKNFPAGYNNNYFFGDYVQGYLKNVSFDASGNASTPQSFDTGNGAIASINFGPDGCLWYLTIFPGEFHKICYGGSTPVQANINANHTYGPLPLTINFSSLNSTGNSLSYFWNFGDNGTSTEANPVHLYSLQGIFTPQLTVTSGTASSTATMTVFAGYMPPTITITAPASGSHYNAGDTVNFSATSTDSSGNPIPAQNFIWRVIPHHNTHIHTPAEFNNVSSGSFTIPIAGEPGHDTWFEFEATATDSNGLTATSSVSIYPNLTALTINSEPSGLQIMLDGQPTSTPLTVQSVTGIQRTLNAASPQTMNGSSYAFTGWSDGGAQNHTFLVPAGTATYTASFTAIGSSTPSSGIVMKNNYPTINNNYIDCNGNIDNDMGHHVTNSNDTDSAHHIGQNCPSGTLVYNFLHQTPETPPPPPGPVVYTDHVTLDKTAYTPGSPVSLNTSITSSQNANNVLVDIEIFNAAGTKILQRTNNVTLNASVPYEFAWNFNAPAAGDYVVKVGVFNSDWSQNLYWDSTAAAFNVGAQTTPPPPTNSGIIYQNGYPTVNGNYIDCNGNIDNDMGHHITNPSDTDSAHHIGQNCPANSFVGQSQNSGGTTTPPANNPPPSSTVITLLNPEDNFQVSGTVEFKALIQGLLLNNYTLGWRTDPNGSYIPFTDDSSGQFKHAFIDFTGWTWRPDHTYPLEFLARDLNQNTIATSTINIIH